MYKIHQRAWADIKLYMVMLIYLPTSYIYPQIINDLFEQKLENAFMCVWVCGWSPLYTQAHIDFWTKCKIYTHYTYFSSIEWVSGWSTRCSVPACGRVTSECMCLKRSENAARVICVLYIYYLCAFFVCAVRVCGRPTRMRTKNAGSSIRWVGFGCDWVYSCA